MSQFEDRVMALINDRVDAMERLFHESEKTGGDPGHDDCCEDIQRKVNKINHDTDEILREIQRISDSTSVSPTTDLSEVFNQPDPDETVDSTEPALTNTPGWMEDGIPRGWKDVFEIIGGILGGTLTVKNWPKLLRWLGKLIPFFLDKFWAVPLIGLAATLWKSVQDNLNFEVQRKILSELQGKIKDMAGKMDDMNRLLTELAEAGSQGGDSSIIVDRLGDLNDKLTEYYDDLNAQLAAQRNLITSNDEAMTSLLHLIRTEVMMNRSDTACVSEWLKGTRSCEEMTDDVYSLLLAARECCLYVKCHLDSYYADLVSRLEDQLHECETHMRALYDEIDDLKRRLTGPDNPIGEIQGAVAQGNVVGTGSLVLNFHNDLNIIKAQCAEIRGLL